MRCLPLLAALVVVGCGGSGTRSPCPERVPGVARVVSSSPGLVTCSYRAGADAFRVTVDSAPQAWVRWQRAQVERAQTALEWSHDPSQAPRFVRRGRRRRVLGPGAARARRQRRPAPAHRARAAPTRGRRCARGRDPRRPRRPGAGPPPGLIVRTASGRSRSARRRSRRRGPHRPARPAPATVAGRRTACRRAKSATISASSREHRSQSCRGPCSRPPGATLGHVVAATSASAGRQERVARSGGLVVVEPSLPRGMSRRSSSRSRSAAGT